MVELTDDGSGMQPTKANVLNAFHQFSGSARPGDHLFFHYSGHGGQMKDQDGDELTGQDQTLVPLDYQTAGQIRDDDVFGALCTPMPEGAKMTCVIDCCHSGTIMDLPYVFVADDAHLGRARGGDFGMDQGNQARDFQHQGGKVKQCRGKIIMFSGCKDAQTSADVGNVSSFGSGGSGAGGACTNAFVLAMNQAQGSTVIQILSTMQTVLRQKGYAQVPQLSASFSLPLDTVFALQ